jgi:hypothetical protein
MSDYKTFLEKKKRTSVISGVEIHEDFLHERLYPFQKYIVRKALSHGRYAIFSECGTGKTLMQLEWAQFVVKETSGPAIILCPLAVSAQTIEEGKKIGVSIRRLTQQTNFFEFTTEPGVWITNYEQIENIEGDFVRAITGIVLDESSILKNFSGATKKKVIETFKSTPYKLCCTATPSPNDDMEICNHAEFLGQGRREEILAMYFTHDGGETSKWRLKGHAVRPFWNFVKSWSVTCSNPSDLGFDGSAFILPKLNLIERVVEVPVKQGKLFNDVSVSATNFNAELRVTLIDRMDEVVDIVNGSQDSFIVWVKQNKEADYLSDKLNGAVEVRGDDATETKEKNLIGFAHDDFRVLVTKTKIACFGLNYQNCHNQVFASLDFSFEQLYQAIRRSYRFGQKHQVNIWLITTDTMANVIAAIKEKQEQYENMKYHLTLN